MRPARLAAVFVIYLGASLAWVFLGASVAYRTQNALSRLHQQVGALWGRPLAQQAPELTVEETVTAADEKGRPQSKQAGHALVPDSSDIKVRLRSDARRKGLLWHRTYAVEFDATYTVKHSYTREPVLVAKFLFPAEQAVYDDFTFSVNGQEAAPTSITLSSLSMSVPLPPGQTATVRVRYKSRGLDSWSYTFGRTVSQVKDFRLVVDTDFRRYDHPERSLSPTAKEQTDRGWRLTWQFTNLISGFNIAVEMPEQPNPGPMVERISFFAPVGLLFFLAVVVIIGIMRGENPHPMHFFFVAAGFFAFHLLMAYLADHLDLYLTFLTCAVVSVLLVVSYLVRAVGANLALRVAAPAQLIYLVLFSYAFFFQGYTGLSITIASILTLAILMHITAKVDWENRFQPPGPRSGTPAAP